MKSIKDNAQSVTSEIKTMLSKALVESAQEKIKSQKNSLMSDKIDLQRQLIQILYTEAFIKEQREHADPLEFIYLSIGHNMHKNELVKQWPAGSFFDMDTTSKEPRDLMEITGSIKVVNQESNKHLKNTRHQKIGQDSINDT